jgi:aldose 1-epimerase
MLQAGFTGYEYRIIHKIREYMKMLIPLMLLWIATACHNKPQQTEAKADADTVLSKVPIGLPAKEDFNLIMGGKSVELFYLKNGNLQAAITNYGGRLVSLLVPDKNGDLVDVIVGPGTGQEFIASSEPYFGATIGRYGNRIANGTFSLDGKKYKLDVNNGPNTLHGGKNGFHNQVWNGKQPNDSTLELSYLSEEGEEGFPGKLNVKVIYTLTADNSLKIAYEATTDRKTVCNLTNHAFFNLNGIGSGTINNHLLQVNAGHYTPVDSTLIPTGKIESVTNTPFDFLSPTTIGARIEADNAQLKFGKGYDHNFVLDKKIDSGIQLAATVQADKTGIVMEILTQELGLQFYGGNFMQAKNILKGGYKDEYRTAFCLETQHFPDSPNHPKFPSTELMKGMTYRTVSFYKFSVAK